MLARRAGSLSLTIAARRSAMAPDRSPSSSRLMARFASQRASMSWAGMGGSSGGGSAGGVGGGVAAVRAGGGGAGLATRGEGGATGMTTTGDGGGTVGVATTGAGGGGAGRATTGADGVPSPALRSIAVFADGSRSMSIAARRSISAPARSPARERAVPRLKYAFAYRGDSSMARLKSAIAAA